MKFNNIDLHNCEEMEKVTFINPRLSKGSKRSKGSKGSKKGSKLVKA